ncbi:MAG: S9 family peptidase [Anaerolineae bacterium]|nr:S9 family peptidase [Anaerolineae bacterium]
MSTPTIAPYGSWKSPITADLVLAGAVNLSQPRFDGDDIYWLEGRALERGRQVVVRRAPDGRIEDITPPEFNARTRVHEYGGGDYTVHDGVIYFANDADQRLYRQRPGEAPEPLTPAAAVRYADLQVDAARGRLLAVREDHRGPGEAVNTLVAVALNDGAVTVLVEGNDFYSTPRLSPDGRQLAWLTWHHPNMPWDGTELWLADVAADGALGQARRVAGGPAESIFQPAWSPPGPAAGSRLLFVSDRSDWWNFYRLTDDAAGRPDEPLYPLAAEFGQPLWVFGMSTYAFVAPDRLVCSYTRNGRRTMALLDTTSGELRPLDVALSGVMLAGSRGRVVYVGASPTAVAAVVLLEVSGGEATTTILRHSAEFNIDAAYLSIAEPVEFPTRGAILPNRPAEGASSAIQENRATIQENRANAYGFFYPPRNRDYAAPAGELPPLIVTSHGGPTSATTDDLNLSRQYWTSRGFAILDVNYGGSTGYGRAYRQRLNGNWGIVDVEDCINGARWLVEQGLVDGERLIIRGGSAGGYTTLRAITGHDVFKAAACYYGISDAEALARDTHKFESRYNDSLIGPYPARRDLYIERSPIHVAYNCSAALILFQGLEDKVVPPDQSEAMFVAARNKELPVAYIPFAGEGHGFRQAANIKRAMEAELYFYGRVFDFEPGEPLEPVDIENLHV